MRAVGLLRMAYPPPVIDEPVVRLRPLRFGDDGAEPRLHLIGRAACGEPQAVGDAENVRIHGDGVAAERERVHDVRRLSPHARERTELFLRRRHFAAEFLHDIARSGEDVRRFVVIKPARKDLLFKLLLREREHLLRGVVRAEEFRRHLVDALVRTLCGEHDGDEQLVRRSKVQRGRRVGVQPFQFR